ncbi:MAG: CDP-alcohol phosphatidyltransferase family protein [Archangium sp.]|nr:CDP-alcohol phosphatidyltransferase family protein [Archangium sp.]
MPSPWNVAHAAALTALLLLTPFISAAPLAVVGVGALTALFLLGRQPGRVGVANGITFARVGLVLAGALSPQPLLALAAFTAVWVLDGLDGWVARARGEASDFGARFDLETDAFFVAALSAALVTLVDAPPWVLVAGLLRYTLVLARAVLVETPAVEYRSRFGRYAYSAAVVCLLGGFLAAPVALPTAGVAVLCFSFSRDFARLRFQRGVWLANGTVAASARSNAAVR